MSIGTDIFLKKAIEKANVSFAATELLEQKEIPNDFDVCNEEKIVPPDIDYIEKSSRVSLGQYMPPMTVNREKLYAKLIAENTKTDSFSNVQSFDYSRPTKFREGVRDIVWENAKDINGRVRDPVTGQFMSKENAWDMGHKPGYEFRKHQESAEKREISREQFLDEYNNPEHYRPELPSSNRSHKGEDVTGQYFGD